MKTRAFLIFAVLLVFASQAMADPVTVGITSVDVTPSQPLDADLITFNISGWASHAPSLVAYDQFLQDGTLLQLDLYVDKGEATAFSYWTFSKEIQPLVPGTYRLEVRAFDDQIGNPWYGTLQDIYNTGFTVTPEPASALLIGFGALFFTSRRKR